ncbi:MAG: methionyl-tRNA formyltransferase [Lachnospiraceae bacterium]
MKIVFMGTPDFAVPTLEACIAHHEVAAVLTQPDKPKGRGKSVAFSPVKEAALQHQLPIYQPVRLRNENMEEVLAQLTPDVIVVVAYGQILPESILKLPKYGCINVHASLLPKYRGAAPIQWSVINGDPVSGVTTMYMEKGLDTGDILMQREVVLDEKETGGSLFDKLCRVGADLLLETLTALEQGTATRTKQDDSLSSYAKMLDKSLGKIDWNQSAVVIERLIRGLNPWPSAYTRCQGKMMKIWDANVILKEEYAQADVVPGTVLAVSKHSFTVACGVGALEVMEMQYEGKKRMKTEAFLLGYSMEPGMKLGESE